MFLRDHNIDRRFLRRLREIGHEVSHASHSFPDRTPDSVLSDRADAEDAIVLTRDRDFSDSWILRG